jgi:hypothetical protein
VLLAAHVERSEGVAVVGGPAADHQGARSLSSRQVIRAGELERRLDGLAAAGHGVDARVVEREHGGHVLRVVLERVGREGRPVDVRSTRGLFGHGVDECAIAVTQTHHDRAARPVEVALAVRVLDPHAVRANGSR